MARVRPGEAANPAPPTVQRVRLRFAKRGRLRFLSHRDVARSFERAVRRAGVPVAHSHGFSPHPRLSWIGAAPTGSASEAEYVEIGLTTPVDPGALAMALDAALPDGLDVLAAAVADGPALADRIDASHWLVELPGVEPEQLRSALAALLAETSVVVERVTPSGRRQIDVRAALVRADPTGPDAAAAPASRVSPSTSTGASGVCAIMSVVVRQTTPAVRPGWPRDCSTIEASWLTHSVPTGSSPGLDPGGSVPAAPAPCRSRHAVEDDPASGTERDQRIALRAPRGERTARAPARPPPPEAPGGEGAEC